MERARVEHREHDVAAEAENGLLLLAKRCERSEMTSRYPDKGGESLQKLQSKVATMTAELRKWRKLANETAEEGKVARLTTYCSQIFWRLPGSTRTLRLLRWQNCRSS